MTDRPCLAEGSACYTHAGSVVRSPSTNQALIPFSSRTIPHPQLPSRPVAASGLSTNEVEVEGSTALVCHRTSTIRNLRAAVSSRVSYRVARSIPRPLGSQYGLFEKPASGPEYESGSTRRVVFVSSIPCVRSFGCSEALQAASDVCSRHHVQVDLVAGRVAVLPAWLPTHTHVMRVIAPEPDPHMHHNFIGRRRLCNC